VVTSLLRWRQETFGAARAAALARLALAGAAVTLGDVLPDLGRFVARGSARAAVAGIGHLVARALVLAAARDTTRVLGPTRPLADPGRAVEHATGGLDEILAAGFGFDAAAVRKRADVVGPLAALAEVPVPVRDAAEAGDDALAHLKAALDEAVAGVASDALKPAATGGRRRGAPDALDDLLARAPHARTEGRA
jgi:hypothetical protein